MKKYAVSLVYTRSTLRNVTVAQFLTIITAESKADAIEQAEAEAYEERDVRRLNLLQVAALEIE